MEAGEELVHDGHLIVLAATLYLLPTVGHADIAK